MKKIFRRIISSVVIVVAVVLFSAIAFGPSYNLYLFPPSAKKYGKVAIELMDEEGIYTLTKDWQEEREIALENIQSAKSFSDTYEILARAVKVAGGKHSKFITPNEDRNDTSFELPKTSIDDNIVYIKLPSFAMNSNTNSKKYVKTVLNFLKENQAADGVILDLRGNSGGDMGPMIGAVSPLLPDGELLFFRIKDHDLPVRMIKGEVIGGGTDMKVEKFKLPKNTPIAILTDNKTASSAEAVLIAFRGLKNVRVFGSDTAGYASCNNLEHLYDGAMLQITVGKFVARTGTEFLEEPISPNINTKVPKKDAINWIKSK
ncbi:S41 family peptidase [Terrisporobacter sp.]